MNKLVELLIQLYLFLIVFKVFSPGSGDKDIVHATTSDMLNLLKWKRWGKRIVIALKSKEKYPLNRCVIVYTSISICSSICEGSVLNSMHLMTQATIDLTVPTIPYQLVIKHTCLLLYLQRKELCA